MPSIVAVPTSTLEGSWNKTRPTAVGEATYHEAIGDRTSPSTRHIAYKTPVNTWGNLFEIYEFDTQGPLPVAAEIDSIQLVIGWRRDNHSGHRPALVAINDEGDGYALAAEESALWENFNRDNERACTVRTALVDGTPWHEYKRFGFKLELTGGDSSGYNRILYAEANVEYTVITPTFTMTEPSDGLNFSANSQIGSLDFSFSHSRGRELEGIIFRVYNLATNPAPLFADNDYETTITLTSAADLASYAPPEFWGPGDYEIVAYPLWAHAGGPGNAVGTNSEARVQFSVAAVGAVEAMPALGSIIAAAEPSSGLPTARVGSPGRNESFDAALDVLKGRDGAGWFDAADWDGGRIPNRIESDEPDPLDRLLRFTNSNGYMNLYQWDPLEPKEFVIDVGFVAEAEWAWPGIDEGTSRTHFRFGDGAPNRFYVTSDTFGGGSRIYFGVSDAASSHAYPPNTVGALDSVAVGALITARFEVDATDYIITVLDEDGNVLDTTTYPHAAQSLPITVPTDPTATGIYSRIGNSSGQPVTEAYGFKRLTINGVDWFNADRHILPSLATENIRPPFQSVAGFKVASSDLRGAYWRMLADGVEPSGTEPNHAITPAMIYYPWEGDNYAEFSGRASNNSISGTAEIPVNDDLVLIWDFGPDGVRTGLKNANDDAWLCPGGWRESGAAGGGMIYIHPENGTARGFAADGVTQYDTGGSAIVVKGRRYLRLVMQTGSPCRIDYSDDGENWTLASEGGGNFAGFATALPGHRINIGGVPYTPSTFAYIGPIYSLRALVDGVEIERIDPNDIDVSVAQPSNGQQGWTSPYQMTINVFRDDTYDAEHPPTRVITRPTLTNRGQNGYMGMFLPKHVHPEGLTPNGGKHSQLLFVNIPDDQGSSLILSTTATAFRGMSTYMAGGNSFTITARSYDEQAATSEQAARGVYNISTFGGFDELHSFGYSYDEGDMQGYALDGTESAGVLRVYDALTLDPYMAGWFAVASRVDSAGRSGEYACFMTCNDALTEAEMQALATARYLPVYTVDDGSFEIQRRLDNFPDYDELAPFEPFAVTSDLSPHTFEALVYDLEIDRLRYVQYRARYTHPERPPGPWSYSGIEQFDAGKWVLLDSNDPTVFLCPEVAGTSYGRAKEIESFEVRQTGRAAVTTSPNLGESFSLDFRTYSRAERLELEAMLDLGRSLILVDVLGRTTRVARVGQNQDMLAAGPTSEETTPLRDFHITRVGFVEVGEIS